MKIAKILLTGLIIGLLASFVLISASAAPGDNIALNCEVESCAYINENEMDSFLVDSDSGYVTKWCSGDSGEHNPDNGDYHWIILDFGENKYFDKVRLVKASEGERDFGQSQYDASAFYFEVSTDKNKWTRVLDVTRNEEIPIYEGSFKAVNARYLKLVVTAAESNPDSLASVRLYDLKVFESVASSAVAPTEETPAPVVAPVPIAAPAPATTPSTAPSTGVTVALAILGTLGAAVTFKTVRKSK